MKHIVDIDSLVNCIDLVRGGMRVNGNIYLPLEVVKEFIRRFPKEPVNIINVEENPHGSE